MAMERERERQRETERDRERQRETEREREGEGEGEGEGERATEGGREGGSMNEAHGLHFSCACFFSVHARFHK